MAYTTKTKVENYLLLTIDSSFDTQISQWIDAVSRFIDNYCNRTFESESAASKLYDGDGTGILLLDDFTAISKIEILDENNNVDETITDADDYFTYPENASFKNKIVLNISNAPLGIFPKGHKNIKIYATFGYSATVPADIELVATKLVAGIIEENSIEETSEIKSESLGEYSVSYQDLTKEMENILGVKDILDMYRRVQFIDV